ncbi:hypothetical protein [Kitasatospora sp. MAA4]|uniref:hypothetical protein n=1 Tax=Kitasatospora sp. MAA4 TaxID=3035093 RepID=UPI002476E239|nr:hypothetical protein [Kitasatospora sp. MAA4]
MKSVVRRASLGAVALAAATSMLLTISPAASAATNSQQVQVGAAALHGSGAGDPLPASELAPQSSPLHVLNGYVTFSKSGYAIDAPASVLNKVPAAQLEQLQSFLAQVNGNIKSGKLEMSADGVAVPTDALLESVGQSTGGGLHPIPMGTWRSHDGYIKTHWYGIEVGLDSWLTNKVEGGFWVGAGVAGLAAALGGGPYAGAAAAALGIIAGGIQVCQHRDGWTIIYWLGTIGAGGFVCNPFG